MLFWKTHRLEYYNIGDLGGSGGGGTSSSLESTQVAVLSAVSGSLSSLISLEIANSTQNAKLSSGLGAITVLNVDILNALSSSISTRDTDTDAELLLLGKISSSLQPTYDHAKDFLLSTPYKVIQPFGAVIMSDVIYRCVSVRNTDGSLSSVAPFWVNGTTGAFNIPEPPFPTSDYVIPIGSDVKSSITMTDGIDTISIVPSLGNASPSDTSLVVEENPKSKLLTAFSSARTLFFRTESLSSTPIPISTIAGSVLGWNIINPNDVPIYVKCYNTASPVVGTTIPIRTIAVPTGAGTTPAVGLGRGSEIQAITNFLQISFNTGLSIAATSNYLSTSTTPPTLPIYIEIYYQ